MRYIDENDIEIEEGNPGRAQVKYICLKGIKKPLLDA
jgi:hypothetical protein